MSSQLLLILIGGLVILALFAGLTWLFVRISRHHPKTLQAPPATSLPPKQTPPPSSRAPQGNRAARRRKG
ncbi:hypothetical protein [Deinococcus sp.]|uniref:hypothetical protein n=1 Tax=Deinococcus sp. TaxID=47478 RepID=UPI003CC680B2